MVGLIGGGHSQGMGDGFVIVLWTMPSYVGLSTSVFWIVYNALLECISVEK